MSTERRQTLVPIGGSGSDMRDGGMGWGWIRIAKPNSPSRQSLKGLGRSPGGVKHLCII
jgi:hypothetical protein